MPYVDTPAPTPGAAPAGAAEGLSSQEARQRLAASGANAIAETRGSPLRALLGTLWSPVPWMLETVIVLQLLLGKREEAAIIAALLAANALLGFFQEHRANRALALLRQRLEIRARVRRDGRWQLIPARELVPGDVIHLRMGDLAPADVRLAAGQVELDQAALTGESLPVEAGPGATAYAGSIIKRGEASGEVTATGARTFFGKTAELVRTARARSHLEATIFAIVRQLAVLDGLLVAAVLVYAVVHGIALAEVIPFTLILLVASVPVALPATFTVATAFGALELAEAGVLVTRLSAIEEAAAMDVLATDKTGTLTENRLTVAALAPFAPHAQDELLRLAALASDDATQDPIDLAILEAARARGLLADLPAKLAMLPFDPHTRRVEAHYLAPGGAPRRVLKGAAQPLASSCAGAPDVLRQVEDLAGQGCRVLGVADGTAGRLEFIGLLALQDPPRADAARLVHDLRALGIRVLMVTGDGLATARAVAGVVGIGARACAAGTLRGEPARAVHDCDVFARVLPEDKFRLVQLLQQDGHVVGMTGDGVNDAPALRQAEMGVAMASATDVAKASASVVLTRAGLADVVAAVQASRRIHQRMLTYSLNKIIKTLEIAVFLSLGLMATGVFVVTPHLIVLLLFTNDFATMSIATDNVAYSRKPDRWHIPTLMAAGGAIATAVLALSFAVFFSVRAWTGLDLAQVQTLMFLMLVFSGQGTVYLMRERRHLWQSRPSRWLLWASLLDILLVAGLASRGVLMAAVPMRYVLALLLVVAAYLVLVDYLKIRVFRRLRVH